MSLTVSTANYLTRTTNLPPIAAWTAMTWVQFTTDTPSFNFLFSFGNAAGGLYYALSVWPSGSGSGTGIYIQNSTLQATEGTALVTNTWMHLALVCAGTGTNQLTLYKNGVQDLQMNGDTGLTAGTFYIGNNFDGDGSNAMVIAGVKLYSVALTLAEIAQEMRQMAPVRTANLNGWYPMVVPTLATDINDMSGAANNWMQNGTPTISTLSPPIPWRLGHRRHVAGIDVLAVQNNPGTSDNLAPAPLYSGGQQG